LWVSGKLHGKAGIVGPIPQTEGVLEDRKSAAKINLLRETSKKAQTQKEMIEFLKGKGMLLGDHIQKKIYGKRDSMPQWAR